MMSPSLVVYLMLLIMYKFNVNGLRLLNSFRRCLSLKAGNEKVIHQRLERIISNRGIGSRNEVAKLFKQGRVSIDGKVVYSGANKYPVNIEVKIDDEISKPIPLLAIYHKPIGVHSVMRDPWGRGTLAELALEYPFLKSLHPGTFIIRYHHYHHYHHLNIHI